MKKSGIILSACFSVLVAAGSSLLASQAPERTPLPNFDRRQVAVDAAASPRKAARATPASVAAEQALAARVPGVRIERDEVLGTAKFVSTPHGFLTGPNGQGRSVSAQSLQRHAANDPHRVVKAFLDEHAAVFGHDSAVLSAARVHRDFTGAHNGMHSVVWQQELDGIDVFEATLNAHTTKRGELINVSSHLLPELVSAADAGTPNRAAKQGSPSISATQAIVLAARNIGDDVELSSITSTNSPAGAHLKQKFNARPKLTGDTDARLVWLPLDTARLRLCWEIVLMSKQRGEMFKSLVDAETGEVLVRRCLTDYISPASYLVYTSDSPTPFSPGWPSPNTNQPPQVPRTLLTLSALSTNASPDGWIPDGANQTLGNNADAHTDHDANNTPDLPRPTPATNRVFAFPIDFAQHPSNFANASVVQLFYWANWYHDKLYDMGFTEAAGNFQSNNFGRGGLGNDAIQADAQDGSGINNANFSTPSDGSPGRVQMFYWNGPNPPQDGDFDAEVVLHELTHGTSNRRVGGGVGMSASQSQGMGEGWSDWYGLALLAEAGDNVDGVWARGAYSRYLLSGLTANYYYGGRRFPYCTDTNINPLTFKDIDPAQASAHTNALDNPINQMVPANAAEVHAQGEVWCIALWECRANLIRKYGFPGNQIMLQIVTDALPMTPANPNFIQARDAILQADLVNNGGANRKQLWQGFAKRGMGLSATSPASSTTTGVVEAFDTPAFPTALPAGSVLVSESCTPGNGVIDPGETITVSLSLTNAGDSAFTNLVATLLAGGGVNAPSGPQNYGAMATNGAAVSRSFTFTADGPCSATITATLHLQDGSNDLGTATFPFTLGLLAATNTITVSNTALISIPSSGVATPYPSAIVVSNVAGTISKVTVTLSNVMHQFAADIDALLVSPGGQKVMIMSDAGGNFYPASTVTVAAADTGHYDSTGFHQAATQNYIAGNNGPGGSSLHRNFFTFNIPALSGPLVGAQLRVNAANVVTADASETYQLVQVTNSIAALTAGGAGLTNIYNDLGDGTVYGSRAFTTNDSGQFIAIALNSTAVTAISNAAGSSFALGGSVTTLDGDSNTVETVFSASSGGGANVQLVLFISTPATLTFDDAAANILPITNLASGTYLPTDYAPGETMTAPAPAGPYGTNLSAFNGVSPNGTWQLYVLDDLSGGVGSINNGWSMRITTQTTNSCCLDPASADVGVSVTATPEPVLVGSNLTYTVVVSNNGPATASGIMVTNALSASLVPVAATPSQGTLATNGANVVWSVGTLVSGASASLSFNAATTAAGIVSNLARAVAANFDYNSSNNTSAAVSTVILPSLAINNASVTEGNSGTTNAIFTVTLSPAFGQTVTVNFATTNGTAISGGDYLATNGVLTFAPGITNQTLIVRVVGDTLSESNETFSVNLTSPVNATISDGTGTGTILDDDPVPLVNIASASVTEGNVGSTNAIFVVSLSAVSGQPVTLTAFTSDGTATAGTDYAAKSNTVTINAGSLSSTFSVSVLGDTSIEPDETFSVAISSPINATLGANTIAVGTIINDDGLPGNLDHFQWSTIGNPQLLNIPFLTTLTARDASNNPATNFNGPASLSGWLISNGRGPIEDFESNTWPHAPWIRVDTNATTGSLSYTFAHDGTNGLRDPEWMYRTDVQIGNPGDQISWWIRPSSANSGRAYFGFGASSNGCWSVVAAPSSGNLLIQSNGNYAFTDKATNTQTWQSNHWYKLSVQFLTTNSVTCNLYDSDGITLLNSISQSNVTGLPGGVAIRSFGNFSLDTINNDSPILHTDFEAGLQGFTINNAFGTGSGLWHLSTGRSNNAGHSPSFSLYYGTNETASGGGNYNTGTNEGVVTSSTIDLTAATAPLQLSFKYLLQSEGGGVTFDQALVEISTNGGASFSLLVGTTNSTLTNTAGAWLHKVVDISAYAGSQAQIRFHFRTVDGVNNAFEGWYVDDIAITRSEVPVLIAPTNAPVFTNGVWAGPVSVLQLATNMVLRAGDSNGHTNDSNPFNVAPLVNDVSLTMTDAPDPVMIGSNLTYTMIASNSGPITATTVTVTNTLPFVVDFVSASTTVGTFVYTNSRVIFSLGNLGAGATVTMNVVVSPQGPGTVTSSANISRGEADQTLVNNTASVSTAVLLPTLAISDAVVLEGDAGTTNAVFTVTLTPSIMFTSKVSFATADGSALAGSDYVVNSGQLTFLPGETTKQISVAVIGDTAPEINETFAVVLSTPILATITGATGVGTILNDDAVPPLSNATRNDFAMPNTTVNAMLETNGVIYLGGVFTEMGTNTGKATPFNAFTGEALTNYPNIDRVVNAVISDGAGGWFLAGDIQSANGISQPRILHLLTNRTIDPAFSASPGSVVNALLLNGTNLYVGGVFTTITNGGTNYPRNRFAVLDSATGAPRSLPSNPSFNNTVSSLALNGSTVYVGGSFTNVANGVTNTPRSHLTALNAATGVPTSFQADVDLFTGANTVNALALDSGTLYLGGSFTNVGGSPRFRIAAVDATTGALSAWNPNMNGTVSALATDGINLYAGGSFVVVTNGASTTTRSNLVALDLATGLPTAWNPSPNGSVQALALTGFNVYVGGNFTAIGGDTDRRRLASVSRATGLATAFDPDVGGTVNALAVDGGVVYAGGLFSFYKGAIRNRLAAIDASTGVLTSWDPNANNTVNALTAAGHTIFAGGIFTNVGGFTATRIAALDDVVGDPVPGFNASINNTVSALAVSGSNLYVGGTFTAVSNTAVNFVRTNLAALNIASGTLNPTFTAQVLSANPLVTSVLAITPAGTNLYVGGNFTNVGGQLRPHLAALNPDTGVAYAWNPGTDTNVQTIIVRSTNVYVGGTFTNMTNTTGASVPRNRIAAISATTGDVTAWNPNSSSTVSALEGSTTNVYAGGFFGIIGGRTNADLMELNAAAITNMATPFSPILNAAVNTLLLSGTRLYVGGAFNAVGLQSRVGFAVFESGLGPVVTLANTNLTYTENNPATLLDPSLTVTELTSLMPTGAVVSIAGNFASGQDVLAFTPQVGISGSYNAGSGVLTLSGAAPAAAYQQALRSVTYQNTSENPSAAPRTVQFVVKDSGGSGGPASFTINVVPVNDPPTILPIGPQTIVENQLSFPIPFTIGDPESAASNLFPTAFPANPVLAPFANFFFAGTGTNRTVRILSGSNQFGSTSVTLYVSDGTNLVNTAFTLTVLHDTDHDGIPDVYETANGMNPNNPADAALDFDGDGMSNLQEYLAGTNPNDPNNYLRVIFVAVAGADTQITFTSIIGKNYRVEKSDDVAAGVWTLVVDNVPGTGGNVIVTDAGGASQPRRAYRVRLLP